MPSQLLQSAPAPICVLRETSNEPVSMMLVSSPANSAKIEQLHVLSLLDAAR